MLITVTSSEIILKGKNRKFFENTLIRNMSTCLKEYKDVKIIKKGGRLLVYTAEDVEAAAFSLKKVFGIDSIFLSKKCGLDIEEIKKTAIANCEDFLGNSIKVSAKRIEKAFPYNSHEINVIIGQALVDMGCSVDLQNPEKTLFIDVLDRFALLHFKKIKGFGGLPVGTSGKVLSLLSGGIDSPVSSWLMMKRGCRVDLLHIYSSSNTDAAEDGKMLKTLEKIQEYSATKIRLFMLPYDEFYKKTFSMDPRMELILFRRFLIKLGNSLAQRHGYKALVTGDSLGQVASQTLDNIMAVDQASALPVFRPLISFNKNEIIQIAKNIGTYDLSLKKYKDCCSIVSTNPSTNVDAEKAKQADRLMLLDEIVEKTMDCCKILII